jgi:hypothetical protein
VETDSLAVPEAEAYMDADADSADKLAFLSANETDADTDSESLVEVLRDAASLSLARLSSATAYDPEADSDCDSISEYTVFSLESRFCSAAKTTSLLFTTPAPPIAIPAAAIPLIMLSTFFLSIWVPPQNKIAVQLCLTD